MPTPPARSVGTAHVTRGFGGVSLAPPPPPPPENATGEFYKHDKSKNDHYRIMYNILSQNDTEYPFSLVGVGGIFLIQL